MGFLGRFLRLLEAASDSCHDVTVTFERQVESHLKVAKNLLLNHAKIEHQIVERYIYMYI